MQALRVVTFVLSISLLASAQQKFKLSPEPQNAEKFLGEVSANTLALDFRPKEIVELRDLKIRPDFRTEGSSFVSSSTEIKPSTVAQHAHERKKTVADGKFLALAVLSAGLLVADAEVTMKGLQNPLCYERNSFVGKNPSRAKVYGFTVPVQAALTALSYWAKGKKISVWWMPLIGTGAMHGGLVAYNAFGSGCL